jgi:hypothetical protein
MRKSENLLTPRNHSISKSLPVWNAIKSKKHKMIASILVLGMLFLIPVIASAVHNTNLFELGDGTEMDGTADIEDDTNSDAPDWEVVFTEVPPDSGNWVYNPSAGGLDAIFIADGLDERNSSDDTAFIGSNKNNDPITSWQWGTTSINSKSDLSNVYAFGARNANEDLILYFGLERIDPGGDSHLDIEINQQPITLEDPSGFVGQRMENDLLLVMDFTNGGDLAQFEIMIWDGVSWQPHGEFSGEGCNSGDTACAFSNGADIDGGPWENYGSKGKVVQDLARNAFTEMGINLTALSPDFSSSCNLQIQAKSRTSDSFNSDLKDFALGNLFLCGARVTVTPASAANQVGNEHTLSFTAEVQTDPNDPTSFEALPVENIEITADVVDGPGSLGGQPCKTNTSGSCTLTLTSNATGLSQVTASAEIPFFGRTLTGVTGDPTLKRWVDAQLTLSPLQQTVGVGEDAQITATLLFDLGSGAGLTTPAVGKTINFTYSEDPNGLSCTTGSDGKCTLIFQESTPKLTTHSASWSGPIVTSEGDAQASASSPTSAETEWVDARISISVESEGLT